MEHRTQKNSRASRWGMAFLIRVMQLTGPKFIKLLLAPIALYYYLTSPDTRKYSTAYLTRLRRTIESLGQQPDSLNRPLSWLVYKHILSFSIAMVDRAYAWSEGVKAFDYDVKGKDLMDKVLRRDNPGALFLVSHLGNFDLSIARSEVGPEKRFNIIMDTSRTRMFNQFRDKIYSSDHVRFIELANITPVETIKLVERVAMGEVVITAADRVISPDHKNSVMVKFLGDLAPLPSGPFILAHLLEVPVYSLFAIKQKGRCLIRFELFENRVIIPRKNRKLAIEGYARKYVSQLESECIKYPFQWYNFYDFWATPKSPNVNTP